MSCKNRPAKAFHCRKVWKSARRERMDQWPSALYQLRQGKTKKHFDFTKCIIQFCSALVSRCSHGVCFKRKMELVVLRLNQLQLSKTNRMSAFEAFIEPVEVNIWSKHFLMQKTSDSLIIEVNMLSNLALDFCMNRYINLSDDIVFNRDRSKLKNSKSIQSPSK